MMMNKDAQLYIVVLSGESTMIDVQTSTGVYSFVVIV